MEKTTKKKKSKRLKRRIGIIAVGGLSLVLTICLSVGATLAWFAGSTWASNDLYMGGPVYVEMAGRSQAGYSNDQITDSKKDAWVAGDGKLDIIASARSTGTVAGNEKNQILLPGQKLLIYSQARVFSTLYYDSTDSGIYPNQSSGANTVNTSNGTATYTDSKGRIKTATTSVLRAKFSINVEFDPSVGFNNFTHLGYANNYPVQTGAYEGDNKDNLSGKTAWHEALYVASTNENTWNTTETLTAYKGAAPTSYDDYGNPENTELSGLQIAQWTGTGANGKTYLTIDTSHDYEISAAEDAAHVAAGGTTTGATADAPVKYFLAYKKTFTGRRDSVNNSNFIGGTIGADDVLTVPSTAPVYTPAGDGTPESYTAGTGLYEIKAGTKTSIFKWKYVSQAEYQKEENAAFRMDKPFDGTVNSAGGASNLTYDKANNKFDVNKNGTGNGYFGLWVGTAGTKSNPAYVDDVTTPSVPKTLPTYIYEESDAFYKARTEAYIKSYEEHYTDEYGRPLKLSIGDQLKDLEKALNDSFTDLVNQSSDRILAGYVNGFAGDEKGSMTYTDKGGAVGTNETIAGVLDKDDGDSTNDATQGGPKPDGFINDNEIWGYEEGKTPEHINATWLYVDPKIGNDINAGASSTDVGGWWYLVETNNGTVASGKNAIKTVVDEVLNGDGDADNVTRIADETDVKAGRATYAGQTIYDWSKMVTSSKNVPVVDDTMQAYTGASSVAGSFRRSSDTRAQTVGAASGSTGDDKDLIEMLPSDDYRILHAKLKEVKPDLVSANNGVSHTNGTQKVVSVSFPFVNGNFELPGQELTNIFANAKISFQISFQALQAFFPYTPSIDGLPAGSALAGTAKALNIENAIPIFNEAFDYLGYLSNR